MCAVRQISLLRYSVRRRKARRYFLEIVVGEVKEKKVGREKRSCAKAGSQFITQLDIPRQARDSAASPHRSRWISCAIHSIHMATDSEDIQLHIEDWSRGIAP